jgi:hypothetical protein
MAVGTPCIVPECNGRVMYGSKYCYKHGKSEDPDMKVKHENEISEDSGWIKGGGLYYKEAQISEDSEESESSTKNTMFFGIFSIIFGFVMYLSGRSQPVRNGVWGMNVYEGMSEMMTGCCCMSLGIIIIIFAIVRNGIQKMN